MSRDTLNLAKRTRLMTLREVADFLHVNYWTAWRLVHSGEIPLVRLPNRNAKAGSVRRLLVDRRDLESLVDRCKKTVP